MKGRRYLALHLPFWAAEHLRQARPDLPVLVMSAQNTFMTAIKASPKNR